MAVTNVRSWLRRPPHPAKLMADDREIAIGEGRNKWRDAENAVLDLGATKLEAINAEGALLRVCLLEQEGAEPDKEDPFADVKLQSREAEIAKLILEATDRGAQRHAEAYTVAFEKMASIVQFAMERASSLEVAWQHALNDRATQSGDDQEGAVAAGLVDMMGRAAGRGAVDAVKEKPNGKDD